MKKFSHITLFFFLIFSENGTNTFKHIIKGKNLEEHRCRTCLSTTDIATRKHITKNLFSDKTIKDMIILLVPEMVILFQHRR